MQTFNNQDYSLYFTVDAAVMCVVAVVGIYRAVSKDTLVPLLFVGFAER